MKKVILVWCMVIMLVLAGCTANPNSNINDTSSDASIITDLNDDNSSMVNIDENDDVSSEDIFNGESDIRDENFDDSAWDDEGWDDDIWGDISWDDSGSVGSGEGGTISYYEESLPKEHTTAYLLNSITGGADKEAKELRDSIENSTDSLNITGQKYYISPKGDDNADGKTPETAWKSLDNVASNNFLLMNGDAILLERGGVYRINSTFVCRSNMTYGAYGEGDKPVIYGSSKNYAWGTEWTPSNKKNVWKLTLDRNDAGIIVFDHGKTVGNKKTNVGSLKSEGDFYHNSDDAILYLYVDGAYPNVKYESIEIGTDNNIITIPQKSKNVVIDNISLKYSGAHGIHVGANASNIKITNCEIGWIGGSYFDPVSKPGARYGNGIQYWLSCENMLVENCYIYQIFDTGFSYQGQGNNLGAVYENIKFKNNLVEFCTMSIEVWDQTNGTIKDVEFSNNILRFSGYGWANQRGNFQYATHFTDYGDKDKYTMSNIVIKDNIFDCSTQNLVHYRWDEGNDRDIIVSNNSFYQKATKVGNAIYYGTGKQMIATNVEQLIEAVKTFDPNPKNVSWVS